MNVISELIPFMVDGPPRFMDAEYNNRSLGLRFGSKGGFLSVRAAFRACDPWLQLDQGTMPTSFQHDQAKTMLLHEVIWQPTMYEAASIGAVFLGLVQ